MVGSTGVVLLAIATPTARAAVQDAAARTVPTSDEVRSAFTVSASATAATAYYFRGIRQEDDGVLVQPAFEIDAKAWRGAGPARDVTLAIGSWNSVHSGPTGTGGSAGESPKAWYESDFHVGGSIRFDHGFTVGAAWCAYTSPNDVFTTITEIGFDFAWDDRGFWGGGFALAPTLRLAHELEHQADQNADPPGTHPGTWLGVGIAPSFTLCDLGDGGAAPRVPLTLELPVLLGLSLGDYYEDVAGHDQTFGFTDLGANFSVPLPFVAERFGKWRFSAGVHLLLLGSHLEASNGGRSTQWIGSAAVSLDF